MTPATARQSATDSDTPTAKWGWIRGMPLWVRLSGIIAVVLIGVFVSSMVLGAAGIGDGGGGGHGGSGGHGSGNEMQMTDQSGSGSTHGSGTDHDSSGSRGSGGDHGSGASSGDHGSRR